MNTWGHTGSWPEGLRQNIVALVPKAGATHEEQLRPKRLLSYVYRIWMVVRKQHFIAWSRTLRRGRRQGAAEMATRTRMDMELADWQGLFTLLALLGCSKCYERVAHAIAGQRAVDTGSPTPS